MSRTDFELKPFARRNDVQSLSESPLNEQQKLAIKRIVGSHKTVPYLIAGPPGTGKCLASSSI
jgi:DNA polymerase III delta prime subunit